jgi:predicted Fe-S protein YdhL (DUF1289 family)
MNRLRQARCWTVAVLAVGPIAVLPLAAATDTNVSSPRYLAFAPTNGSPPLPPLPQAQSPVAFFRKLLAMTPAEQENYLTNRPPQIRSRILAKIREYQALDPNEREARLRATELRWYLLPLLRTPPADRGAQLAAVPDDLRNLVQARLSQWEILPPPLQQEFLENERALRYFTQVDASGGPLMPGVGGEHKPPDSDLAQWNALSDEQRQRILDQFRQFFELTPVEKQKTLNTLSPLERRQMEKTLQTFDQLPPPQRRECVRAFTNFAGMDSQARAEFLKNAERWSQMSPQERQTWRDLVANVPKWPPMPPPPPPPMPPMPSTVAPSPRPAHPTVATNRN